MGLSLPRGHMSDALLEDLGLLPPPACPQGPHGPAQQVEREEDEQEPLRMGGHDEHAEHHEHEDLGGPAAREVHFLEAVVAEGRDHEERDDHRTHAHGRGLPARHLHAFEKEGGGGDDTRRGRRGQPHEVAAVRHALVDVEAGETEGAADHEEEGPQPGDPPGVRQGEGVEDEGGGDAEGHHVGERVELDAELGGRPGQPGHLAVEDVQDHAHEDRHRRLHEARLGREHDGEKAAKEIGGGEETGEQKDAAARVLAQLLPAAPPRMPRPLSALMPTPHRSTPMTVSPPLTLSPIFTRISVERGTTRSVRDPKRISPYRSPAASLSPTRTRHTMRRASTPAPCLVANALDPTGHRRSIHVHVERREKDGGPHRPPHPRVLYLVDPHHAPVRGSQHEPRRERRRALRVAKEAEAGESHERQSHRRRPPAYDSQNTRGRRGDEDKRPPLRGDGDSHAPAAYIRGGLIQDIILRSRPPTSSIGWSASRFRMARNPARWAWFSRIHSRANWPVWISPRIFRISTLVSG